MPARNRRYTRFESIVKKAEEFHGHLGPFLTIGVKMGLIGLDSIKPVKDHRLTIAATLPLRVPFSCIIDGLQITTKCTIGNQKLSLNEGQVVRVEFRNMNDGKKAAVSLNQRTFRKLESQILDKSLADEQIRRLAWQVATIPDEELFIVT